jgi:hypothetical protein
MKFIMLSLFSLPALSLVTACTVVESREPSTHTTRTTIAEVAPTSYGTVETKTIRSY